LPQGNLLQTVATQTGDLSITISEANPATVSVMFVLMAWELVAAIAALLAAG